ncbi:hypothetical protein BD309DRAFT_984374 [Dichomitus squalens]|nr:hypothetical protein BD309DRAFT_984374 [Dichomitus squalens]
MRVYLERHENGLGSAAQSGNFNIDAEFPSEDNSSGSQSDPDPASSNPDPSSSPVSSPSPSDSEPSSESTHVILIVGCTLGALLVVSIVAFVLWWKLRKPRSQDGGAYSHLIRGEEGPEREKPKKGFRELSLAHRYEQGKLASMSSLGYPNGEGQMFVNGSANAAILSAVVQALGPRDTKDIM